MSKEEAVKAQTKEDKLIVALDVSSADEAVKICKLLMPQVGFFKVGLTLFAADGHRVINEIKELGAKVFLDLKLHDIPTQITNTCKLLGSLGVDMITVHCLGGPEMLRAARFGIDEGAREANLKCPIIVGVTILTSLDVDDMEKIGIYNLVQIEVGLLAGLARNAGLDGVVASARELSLIRDEFKEDFIIVSPGIRPSWAPASSDQKRVLTPAEAIRGGSDFLVIGRPIIEAHDPAEAAYRIIEEMKVG